MKEKKVDDLTLPLSEAELEKKKKKSGSLKYVICVGLVLVLTVFSLVWSLFSAGGGDSWGAISEGAIIIWQAIKSASIGWMLGTLGLVFASYCIDGLVILVFCRLYTRHYHFFQGLANTMIGAFYSAVTPGASGGQVMQIYTLKKQGIEVSNAASIMVMWFILYQSNLILFDIIAILVEWNKILSISSFTFTFAGFSITLLPLIVIGFILNLGTLALLFLMSYSHRFHNFIMHYVVNFLAKLHIVKNPDKSRENLRVQVENFKIELRRLQSNVPVTVLLSIMFLLVFFLRFSIPYFTGLSLDAVGGFSFAKMMDTCFLSAFHQMVTGVFPLPGGAGVSELFFTTIFKDIIGPTTDATGAVIRTAEVNMASAQILWRTATFHLVVIAAGLVSALYRGRPQENYNYANRQTFVNLQLETYETRKISADTLYETSQLSRKNIINKLGTLDTSEELPTKNKRKRSKTKSKKKEDTFLG